MTRQRAKDTEVMRRVMMARRRRRWRRWVAAPQVARVPRPLSCPLPLSAQPGHSLTQGKVAKATRRSSTPLREENRSALDARRALCEHLNLGIILVAGA